MHKYKEEMLPLELQDEGETLPQNENEMLPPEVLYYILSFLKKPEILLARSVNRTWYHLIQESPVLFVPLVDGHIKNILKRRCPDKEIPDYPQDAYTVAAIAKALNSSPNPQTSRALITVKNQLSPHNLLNILQRSGESFWDAFSPHYDGQPIFGRPSLTKVALAFLGVCWFLGTVGTMAYLFADGQMSYREALQGTASRMATSFYNTHKYTAVLTLLFWFSYKLYSKYLESNAIDQEQVLDQVAQAREVSINVDTFFVSAPATLLSMSWKRENVLDSQIMKIPSADLENNDDHQENNHWQKKIN
ncbi:MAG: F-box protein [Gammaproteobacteria bacterium]|nr:F-box protein [Gammaproteobacteria bacterium]